VKAAHLARLGGRVDGHDTTSTHDANDAQDFGSTLDISAQKGVIEKQNEGSLE
jgi:hypothetical protein